MANKAKIGCTSCGKKWEDHDGIAQTCKKYKEARSILAIIDTWFKMGDYNMKHVERLINDYFEREKK